MDDCSVGEENRGSSEPSIMAKVSIDFTYGHGERIAWLP